MLTKYWKQTSTLLARRKLNPVHVADEAAMFDQAKRYTLRKEDHYPLVNRWRGQNQHKNGMITWKNREKLGDYARRLVYREWGIKHVVILVEKSIDYRKLEIEMAARRFSCLSWRTTWRAPQYKKEIEDTTYNLYICIYSNWEPLWLRCSSGCTKTSKSISSWRLCSLKHSNGSRTTGKFGFKYNVTRKFMPLESRFSKMKPIQFIPFTSIILASTCNVGYWNSDLTSMPQCSAFQI